jgi:hypothetical protein
MARAKSEVQEFASQIIQWVTQITLALEEGRINLHTFGLKIKRNLEERRYVDVARARTEACAKTLFSSLIREICVWAAARLVC